MGSTKSKGEAAPPVPTIPQEARERMTDAERQLEVARRTEIADGESYQRAAEQLKSVKALSKELDGRRREITKPLDDAKARVMEMFKPPLKFLSDAEGILKRSMAQYDDRLRRERAERERAERERLEKERQRKERLAREAEDRGDAKRAAEHERAAEEVAAAAPVRAAPQAKAEGISTRQVWKAEVVDFDALVQAVADGTTPQRFLSANTTELGKLARALQNDAKVPGVRFYSETSVTARS